MVVQRSTESPSFGPTIDGRIELPCGSLAAVGPDVVVDAWVAVGALSGFPTCTQPDARPPTAAATTAPIAEINAMRTCLSLLRRVGSGPLGAAGARSGCASGSGSLWWVGCVW